RAIVECGGIVTVAADDEATSIILPASSMVSVYDPACGLLASGTAEGFGRVGGGATIQPSLSTVATHPSATPDGSGRPRSPAATSDAVVPTSLVAEVPRALMAGMT